jgi:RimJ/RimL family protein N-acetyltransferase
LNTTRLVLDPLTDNAHVAAEMADVLSDPALYVHTGGEPPDAEELRARYTRQSLGVSPDGSELWFNWIVRRRPSGDAIGFVQVTLVRGTGVADLAWVIAPPFQRRGYATEAARAVLAWLALRPDVTCVTAHVADANVASQSVARHLDLARTSRIEDGEVVWEHKLRD